MDNSTPTGKILATLRQHIKENHLSNRKIAKHLFVSEATVKRYLNGQGVTIEILQKLAELVGLDFFTLTRLAGEKDSYQVGFSEIQEKTLASNPVLRAVFYMLDKGWTLNQIQEELELGDRLSTALSELEALNFIRRDANRIVKVLVRRDRNDLWSMKNSKFALDAAGRFLSEFDLRSSDCGWIYFPARLSLKSVQILENKLVDLRAEIESLTEQDRERPSRTVRWYEIVIGLKPANTNYKP